MANHESVEEFLARGGTIQEVPFGVTGEKIQLKRGSGKDKSRVKAVSGGLHFNPTALRGRVRE